MPFSVLVRGDYFYFLESFRRDLGLADTFPAIAG